MAKDLKINSIKNKIWLTSKTRMQAEKRYNIYNNVAHIYLCIFSFLIVGLSVFSRFIPNNVPIDAYNIWFSVFVIIFTTIVFGFRFGETAVLHRECYIRLQKLYDSRSDIHMIEDDYHNIISSYPNHTDTDYDRLILNRTLFHSSKLEDPNGNPLTWNLPMLVKFIFSQLLLWFGPVIVFAASVGSIFWLW